MEIVSKVIIDLGDTFEYLPFSVCVGAIITLGIFLWRTYVKKSCMPGAIVKYFLFIFYLLMVLEIAYISREPGSRDGVDMIILSTWGESVWAKAAVIENVMMFLPFGVMVPWIWKKLRKFKSFVLLPIICSIALEGLQLVTKRGYCQIDDVLTNTCGAIVGFFLYKIWDKRRSCAR